ncbi:MAG: iron-containing alcohol dehydrogenase [Candidatus Competibacteraceae bacterium]|nr:iron-containing alcohol dehydrogenase [Candidatus Competibacteraceae bacterium]
MSTSLTGNWNYPTAMRFGAGRIKELPEACRSLGMQRPLLITDPALAALPMVQDTLEICRAAGLPCGLFSDVQGNPVEANVSAGVQAFKDGGHDGVIAFGGGSGLDAAKAVALMVGQTRPIWDFEDREDWWTRINPDGMAPVVAVPTTAGTGSEVGRASVITDERDHTKKIIFHPKMLPAIVIADPELTLGLPAHITAATGMDALSHNLEAFCSPLFHPMAEGIAVEGMRLIKDWLPVAVADGSNLTARANMLVASSMGATAFQKGLGAMHSLSHPCGSVLNTHHGLTNAVVMPYVLEFNRSAISEKLVRLARFLDLPNPSFDAVLNWVLELREQVGIPHTLKEIGVTEEYAAQLAPMAAADPSSGTNPIPLTAANLEPLYLRCIRGELAGG